MNAKIKAAWLSVLASDTYQTSANGHLLTLPTEPGTPTTYSALGVLREIALAAGVTDEPLAPNQFWLPQAVAEWAEMDALPWMKLDEPSGIFNLAYINKLGGGTFDLEAQAIADHL